VTDDATAAIEAMRRLVAEADALIAGGRLTVDQEARLRTGLEALLGDLRAVLRKGEELAIRQLLGDLLTRPDQA
jgi:hypothetical protein